MSRFLEQTAETSQMFYNKMDHLSKTWNAKQYRKGSSW